MSAIGQEQPVAGDLQFGVSNVSTNPILKEGLRINYSMNSQENAWRQFKRWKYIGLGGMFACFGIPILVTLLEPSLSEYLVKPTLWVYLYFCMTIAFIAYGVIRQQLFRCPRCHNYFFSEAFFSPPLMNKNSAMYKNYSNHCCVHCGLKLYAPSPE